MRGTRREVADDVFCAKPARRPSVLDRACCSSESQKEYSMKPQGQRGGLVSSTGKESGQRPRGGLVSSTPQVPGLRRQLLTERW